MVQNNPEILDILQDDAKDNSDDAVFVSSEGSVLRRMECKYDIIFFCAPENSIIYKLLFLFLARSSWSHAHHPIEICDLTKKESLEYLKKRKINEEQAEKIYKLVSRRMVDLNSIVDELSEGTSFDGKIDFIE